MRDRKTYIGGSSVSVIMTGEGYGGQTSADLCRWYQSDDTVETEINGPMQRGIELEAVIARRLQQDGWDVHSQQLHVSGSQTGLASYLGGTIDGICTPYGYDEGILEIKAPSTFTLQSWIDDGLPASHIWQCRLYMALTDRIVAYLVAWDLNSWDYKVWEIERDHEQESVMMLTLAEFWACVQGGNEWEATVPQAVQPRIGAEAVQGTLWHERLLLEYGELQATKKAAEARLLELREEIAMEWPDGAKKVSTGIGSASYSAGRTTERIDAKRLQKEAPEVWEKYKVTTTGQPILRVTIKKGILRNDRD